MHLFHLLFSDLAVKNCSDHSFLEYNYFVKRNIIRTDILKCTIIVFKDLIICSCTKCSANLATTNSTGVGKWSDDFSLFYFKNIYSTFCHLKRYSLFQRWIKFSAWHSFMSVRSIYFSVLLYFFSSHIITTAV